MKLRRHPLRKWCWDTGKTCAWLAEQIGISRGHLSNVMSSNRPLSMPDALRAALVTGIPVEKLLGDRKDAEILELYGSRQTSEAGDVKP